MGALQEIDVKTLFGSEQRIVLAHDSKRYLLQITRQRKLLLTRDEDARDHDASSGRGAQSGKEGDDV